MYSRWRDFIRAVFTNNCTVIMFQLSQAKTWVLISQLIVTSHFVCVLFFSLFFFPLFPLSLPHQRQAKYSENKLKVMKARNEYLLTLEAANAALFKYYIQDLSHLIDVSIITVLMSSAGTCCALSAAWRYSSLRRYHLAKRWWIIVLINAS